MFYRPSHLSVDRVDDPLDHHSINVYCTFVGGNLITWCSNKQTVIARSGAEAKYQAMAHTACEMIWV